MFKPSKLLKVMAVLCIIGGVVSIFSSFKSFSGASSILTIVALIVQIAAGVLCLMGKNFKAASIAVAVNIVLYVISMIVGLMGSTQAVTASGLSAGTATAIIGVSAVISLIFPALLALGLYQSRD